MSVDSPFVGASGLGGTRQLKSGIYIVEPGTLRSWVKLQGEPAQTFAETPNQFKERWLAFAADPGQEWESFHEYASGHPVFFFRQAIGMLAYIGVTYQTTAPRVTIGGLWNGDCPCSRCVADRGDGD